MTPIEVYRIYVAIKLHFTSDYDALKYNFRVSASDESFFRRRDRYFFEKIAKRYPARNDVIYFFLAQFLAEVDWVGDMANDDGYDRYLELVGRLSRVDYVFADDMRKLFRGASNFDDLFLGSENAYPKIVEMLSSQVISDESFCLANRTINFVPKIHQQEPLIWPALKSKMLSYQPFVPFNRAKCMNVLTELVKGINR